MGILQLGHILRKVTSAVITTLVIFAIVTPAVGHHTWGGTMSYKAIEVNSEFTRFNFSMQIARGPEGANFDNPAEFAVWRIVGDEYELFKVYNVQLTGFDVVHFPNYEDYIIDDLYVIQLGHYEATIDLPNDGYDYMIGYRRCCRVDDLRNIRDASSEDPAQPGSAYGVTITNRAIALGNSSPVCDLHIDYLVNIRDSLLERSLSFSDIDGDSLVYSFAPPRLGGGLAGGSPGSGDQRACNGIRPDPDNCPPPFVDADYYPEHSFGSPFGPDTDVNLDPNTGFLKGGKLNNGLYTVGLTVMEYREGVVLSTSYMDYTFYVDEIDRISVVSGYRFFDINKNGVRESNEPDISHLTMHLLPPALKARYFSDGAYSLFVKSGNYSVFASDSLFGIPDNVEISVGNSVASIYKDIPYVAKYDVVKSVPAIRIFGARCNTAATLEISVFNSGVFMQSGIVTVHLDNITTLESSDIPNLVALGGNKFQFSYDSLAILSTTSGKMQVNIPGQDFLGDTMLFKVDVTFRSVIDPGLKDTAYATVRNIVSCSYDPNAKYTFPTRDRFNTIYPGEKITYTIAFQNLGNDTAYNVRIADHLNHILDIRTLIFLEGSHDYYCEEVNGFLTFFFDNINLPPVSHDSLGSNGYISLSAYPYRNVELGTIISNTAMIYFDKNPAVVTSWVYNTIGLRPESISDPGSEGEKGIVVFPNPSRHFFQFTLDELLKESSEIFVFNVAGQVIINQFVQGRYFSIELDAGAGAYYYQIIDPDGSKLYSGKLVLVK